jgi:hypothetical protein
VGETFCFQHIDAGKKLIFRSCLDLMEEIEPAARAGVAEATGVYFQQQDLT